MDKKSDHSLARRSIDNIRRRIVTGLLFLLPVAITYLVLRFLFNTVDGILQPGFEAIFGEKMPGLGLVAIIIIVYLVGLLGSNILGRWFARIIHGIFVKTPIVNIIYTSAKQLIDSFSGTKTTGFKRVVIVEYPRKNVWTIGFLTGMVKDENDMHKAIVYIPTAPTPQSGWMLIYPAEDVYDTDLSVNEALRMVLSGGIISPSQIKRISPVSVDQ